MTDKCTCNCERIARSWISVRFRRNFWPSASARTLHPPSSVIWREKSILIFVCCFYMHWQVFRIVLGMVHHAHLVLHKYTLSHPPTPGIIAVFIDKVAVHLIKFFDEGRKLSHTLWNTVTQSLIKLALCVFILEPKNDTFEYIEIGGGSFSCHLLYNMDIHACRMRDTRISLPRRYLSPWPVCVAYV